ncbi:MAG: helix-turn-helix transcriptional regulator [Lachnospiraceae bacterium]|nr:helix-turn-helix transcriptional regulator [Lachnospiraceae bacterium]
MKKPKINIERLKEKRLEKGWNKVEAAEFMAMPHSIYLRYESGERSPSYTALRDMALTLGTTVEYLTDQTDDDRPEEYLISAKDNRLICILETYNKVEEDGKQRLYNYAKKLHSDMR